MRLTEGPLRAVSPPQPLLIRSPALVIRFGFPLGLQYGADEARDSLFPEGIPENFRQRLLKEGLQPDYSSEDLLGAYDELTALGLTGPAAIALEITALKVSRFHMPSPPWVADSRTWEDKERKRKEWEAERQQRLSKPHKLAQ